MAAHLETQDLFQRASAIRETVFGKEIRLCMIINAKCGVCDMDCGFCSQSAHHNASIASYPLLSREILGRQIAGIAQTGVHHCGLVTSGGRLTSDDLERLCSVIQSYRTNGSLSLCASLGRLAEPELWPLRQAGLSRFHHNLETSRTFYPSICTTQTWQQRVETIRAAQRAGLEVCTGGLFGLGESWQDRIDLAISLRALGITSVPINFLHARPGTPMADRPALAAEEALRIIAVYRHILPGATLRICGGRPHVLGDRQKDIFAAGANALMTGDYLTTSGRGVADDLAMIHEHGLVVAP